MATTTQSTRSEAARQVLENFRAGQEAAFEALYRLHQQSVYGWVLRIVRDRGAAEDLTIETFWRIFRASARFDASRDFAAWARRIATRAALDWMRSDGRQNRLSAELPEEIAAPPAGDAAVAAEIRRQTAAALHRLPPALRIAATLAVVEEQPHKVIADALGISQSAVKVRVFRAMRLLRKDLEKRGIRP